MAELTFFTGVMDSGKSTLALQTNHNRQAIEVSPDFDFWNYTVDALAKIVDDRGIDVFCFGILPSSTPSRSLMPPR